MDKRVIPIDRIDNGDGTVTWKPRLDPRARPAHFIAPVVDWPGCVELKPPKRVGPPPRCLPLNLKDRAE